MTDEVPAPAAPGATAGALLREARQAQGMHIAALAAAIKVTPRKLEALEGDRYEELPDLTFTRALAQAVCRALKIDAEPVLARLPQTPGQQGLEHVSRGLNTPFRERSARRESRDWPAVNGPVLWGSVLLVLAAGAVYLVPQGWLPSFLVGGAAAPASAASAPTAAASAPAMATAAAPVLAAPTVPASAPAEVPAAAPLALAAGSAPAAAPAAAVAVASGPAVSATSASPAPAAGVADGSLQLQTAGGPSWIEVRDAKGKVLIARMLNDGESVGLEGQAPMRLTIGDARVTRVRFHGQAVALPANQTLARLELK
jgi:cytoskeleton protein RodZ